MPRPLNAHALALSLILACGQTLARVDPPAESPLAQPVEKPTDEKQANATEHDVDPGVLSGDVDPAAKTKLQDGIAAILAAGGLQCTVRMYVEGLGADLIGTIKADLSAVRDATNPKGWSYHLKGRGSATKKAAETDFDVAWIGPKIEWIDEANKKLISRTSAGGSKIVGLANSLHLTDSTGVFANAPFGAELSAQKLQLLPDAVINGEACDVIKASPVTRRGDVVIFLAKSDHLPRQVHNVRVTKQGDMKTVYDFAGMRANASLTTDSLHPELPDGFTKEEGGSGPAATGATPPPGAGTTPGTGGTGTTPGGASTGGTTTGATTSGDAAGPANGGRGAGTTRDAGRTGPAGASADKLRELQQLEGDAGAGLEPPVDSPAIITGGTPASAAPPAGRPGATRSAGGSPLKSDVARPKSLTAPGNTAGAVPATASPTAAPVPETPKPAPAVTSLPDLELKAADGSTVSLSSLKGSVLILQFFGSWSLSGKDALAEAQAVADQHKDKVRCYALSLRERSNDNAIKYLKEAGLTTPLLLDADKLAEALRLSSYPAAVIVWPDGSIAKCHEGFKKEEWTKRLGETVNALLNNTPVDAAKPAEPRTESDAQPVNEPAPMSDGT